MASASGDSVSKSQMKIPSRDKESASGGPIKAPEGRISRREHSDARDGIGFSTLAGMVMPRGWGWGRVAKCNGDRI